MALEDWKTTADLVQAAVTSIAVVAGGIWAYFRFVKGRTFKPRVEADVGATWLGTQDDVLGLCVRVQLKNIGAAKVNITQTGTAVEVSRLKKEPSSPLALMRWCDSDKGYDIFCNEVAGKPRLAHEWIEPGETIADEFFLPLPIEPDVIWPQIIRVRFRIILKRTVFSNISVDTRRIFTLGSNGISARDKDVRPSVEPTNNMACCSGLSVPIQEEGSDAVGAEGPKSD